MMVWHPVVDLFVPGYFLRIQSLTITFVVGEPSDSTASLTIFQTGGFTAVVDISIPSNGSSSDQFIPNALNAAVLGSP